MLAISLDLCTFFNFTYRNPSKLMASMAAKKKAAAKTTAKKASKKK
ncbi:hypothetical protein [Nitrosopumilus sp. S6]